MNDKIKKILNKKNKFKIICLTSYSKNVAEEADKYAYILDQINKERRDVELTMKNQAFKYVEQLSENRWPDFVCVYDKSWHQGVVGLIAARVKEHCHRPVIAFARENDSHLKGSARSIQGVHIRDLLEAISTVKPGLIEKFGGHAMAAGLTITEESLNDFKVTAAEQMRRLYPNADFSGAIMTDGPLPVASLNLNFARSLRNAGPWGSAFPEPIWSGDFNIVEQRIVGENHLKLRVRPAKGDSVIDGGRVLAAASKKLFMETQKILIKK